MKLINDFVEIWKLSTGRKKIRSLSFFYFEFSFAIFGCAFFVFLYGRLLLGIIRFFLGAVAVFV